MAGMVVVYYSAKYHTPISLTYSARDRPLVVDDGSTTGSSSVSIEAMADGMRLRTRTEGERNLVEGKKRGTL